MIRAIFISSLVLIVSCNNNAKVKTDTASKDTVVAEVKQEKEPFEGEFIKRYQNGVIEQRGMMKAGKRDGVWKSFYTNGFPWSETTFVLGKKEGPTTSWYENGQKRYTGSYTNDLESGIWNFYDDKGVLVTTKDYSKE